MSEETDIKDFTEKFSGFSAISEYESSLIDLELNLSKRSLFYLELLAGAFMQETGLKPSEAELVCEYIPNISEPIYNAVKIKWYFRKKSSS